MSCGPKAASDVGDSKHRRALKGSGKVPGIAASSHAAILEQLAEGVIVTDARGRITMVNKAAATIHGVSLLDIEPSRYSEAYSLFTMAGDPYPPSELALARAVRGETVLGAQWRIRRADGAEIFCIGNAQPLKDEDGVQIGAVLTLRDDTARQVAERDLRKLNEDLANVVEERTTEAARARTSAEIAQAAAERASAAKSDFLACMSHEIRTPLNGVIAVADMLVRSNLPDRERGMVEIIRSSGKTLQSLLSDILDMAQVESGKLQIEAAPFHLGDMLRGVAALSQLRCDESGVRLHVDIAPEVDVMTVGDLVRVRQIVTNFMSNAVKFTSYGEISLKAERLERGLTRLTVTDTGVGFSMKDKAKVLSRFEQADTSITRRFGGSGLGLSISCNLAALMGGALDCDSEPGVGSRFWVDLPLDACDDVEVAEEDATSELEDGRPLRILLADDHPTNREVVKLMLEDQRVELTCAEDGAQALEAYRSGTFDLILMDMQMPVMDGLTAMQLVRGLEADAGRPRTPAIMLTANALPQHVSAALRAGADLHLAKPFTATKLFGALNSVLGTQTAEDPSARDCSAVANQERERSRPQAQIRG